MSAVLLVVAKAPVAGLAKTRLCPPATPLEAARIAAASLLRTLRIVRQVPDARPVVALTGELAAAEAAPALHAALHGMAVLPQRGEDFADRLANAHADASAAHPGLPVLQIGMDTPQVEVELLAAAADRLTAPGGPESVLGPAEDGGWWALGLRDPGRAEVLRAVPMSRPDTGELTRAALAAHGAAPEPLPALSDVDTMAIARAVAELLPCSEYAAAVHAVAERPAAPELAGEHR